MLKNILIPLDGSELAEKALAYGKFLAKNCQANLTLLQVVPPLIPAAGEQGRVDLVQQEQAAQAYLGQLQEQCRAEGVSSQVEVLAGGPVAEMIIEWAGDHQIDLIVMSSHGYSGNERWVYGSVANKVLQGGACPIFLVRGNATHLVT